MMHIPSIYIQEDGERGRGVFIGENIDPESIIEVCPIIELSEDDIKKIDDTHLFNYYFSWGSDLKRGVIALGYGSLYNHSDKPNADFILDYSSNQIIIKAIKAIDAGDQIFINYHLGSKSKIWFEVK